MAKDFSIPSSSFQACANPVWCQLGLADNLAVCLGSGGEGSLGEGRGVEDRVGDRVW